MSVLRGNIARVTPAENEDEEVLESWTNPYIAEYERRSDFLKATNAYHVNLKLRSLNLASYAFSRNAQEMVGHVGRYPGFGQFTSAVSDPYSDELARLLHNTLASASSLISGQRVVLRHIWPKIGRTLSEFESGEYTNKRVEVFETDEAEFIVELRNYSQHYFLPRLEPRDTFSFDSHSTSRDLQFLLEVKPLYDWSGLAPKVKPYLEAAGESIALLPILERYAQSVREFYTWFWAKAEEKLKDERAELEARTLELRAWGEEVFLAPDWFRKLGGEPPPDWNGRRWMRREKAKIRLNRWQLGYTSRRGITVDSEGVAEVGHDAWTPIYLRA